ncbi:MAG: class I SAM-dependent methyltransferase [Verrucomicrobia bacterium]|nr:class I SAM-dependent methyltransferase [Verrucomicrobiota bacterium]
MNRETDSRYPQRPTAVAHELGGLLLGNGAVVIDATAGNGHDTVWLAERVGETGRVLAFDVQAAAIEAARRRVEDAGWLGRVAFYQESHVGMDSYAPPGSVSLVMFNLGYLPGGDHGLTTERETTLAALEAATRVLRPGGGLSVVCYPGHAAGVIEAEAVGEWFARLGGSGWRMSRHGAEGTLRPAPFLLFALKPGACGSAV